MTDNPIVTFSYLVRTEEARSTYDRRFMVEKHLVSYRDTDNNEYRVSFEIKRGGTVRIPESGKIRDITKDKKQW